MRGQESATLDPPPIVRGIGGPAPGREQRTGLGEEAQLRSRIRLALGTAGLHEFPVPEPFNIPDDVDGCTDGAR